MADVVCLGEMLVDFVSTQPGAALIDAPAFQKAAGGAPANVAVGLARLGVSSAFMGKVGDDDFGRFLARALETEGVNTSGMSFSTEARTGLAFVSLREDGEREFLFFRHPSADILHSPDDVDAHADLIRAARVFHYGSITLIQEPARNATLRAIEIAKEAGCLISYDPNLRLNLWPDANAAREGIKLGWAQANVIKASEEELLFAAETGDADAAARQLWHDGLRLLAVTLGAAGCRYRTPSAQGRAEGFAVETVDTTGAGDGFVAGLLSQIARSPALLNESNTDQLEAALRVANVTGALTTTQYGAIPALPRAAELERFLAVDRQPLSKQDL